MQVAWQQQLGWQVGERERRAGRQDATAGGHRARSLPFITEPTSHTTSSPQIRDVLFFSLPSTLFFPRTQANRSHAHAHARRARARAHNHHHTGPGTWDLDPYSGTRT